jgi:UDP-N-acetylglucosamine--N-acetylmuramyl-(pentapeptide) pyrophosphoryl-undecaprenol N-acetylglucosamine transferase
VAERLLQLDPSSHVHFLCSDRSIDHDILSRTPFDYTPLPARGYSLNPGALVRFLKGFQASIKQSKRLFSQSDVPIVIGVGGFAAAPACWAAHKLNLPLMLINVDMTAGKANRLIGRWANHLFLQFEETRRDFHKSRAVVDVVGCPLRSDFENPRAQRAQRQLGLDPQKHVLLITGASSGARHINETVCSLLPRLDQFAETWQIVHLTGERHVQTVSARYQDARISHHVRGYFDDMADLLAATDLLIGRSGAVSVAEYAASGVPSICMPYPFHKDRHQYLNAAKLVEAGAAVIVDDVPDPTDRAEWLWEALNELMTYEERRKHMAQACKHLHSPNAATAVAQAILAYVDTLGPVKI